MTESNDRDISENIQVENALNYQKLEHYKSKNF